MDEQEARIAALERLAVEVLTELSAAQLAAIVRRIRGRQELNISGEERQVLGLVDGLIEDAQERFNEGRY